MSTLDSDNIYLVTFSLWIMNVASFFLFFRFLKIIIQLMLLKVTSSFFFFKETNGLNMEVNYLLTYQTLHF